MCTCTRKCDNFVLQIHVTLSHQQFSLIFLLYIFKIQFIYSGINFMCWRSTKVASHENHEMKDNLDEIFILFRKFVVGYLKPKVIRIQSKIKFSIKKQLLEKHSVAMSSKIFWKNSRTITFLKKVSSFRSKNAVLFTKTYFSSFLEFNFDNFFIVKK